MQYAIAAAALVAAVSALPQELEIVRPAPGTADASCKSSYDGTFNIMVVNVTSSSMQKRQTMGNEPNGELTLSLKDGVLRDSFNRIGNIVANNQFQFDLPLQQDAKITKGWAICPNSTLVLGRDAVFKQCLSGNFYNLYDENAAGQCNEIYIQVAQGGAMVRPSATSAPAANVTQIGDGQAQGATSAAPVSQIQDGQIQASTGAMPVTQISDGQIQAPTGAPVTQIADGQIQVPTGAPVTQIADGQIQAPTGAPVSQIGDGQIQAPTNRTAARPSPSIQAYTGGASAHTAGVAFGLVAAAIAVAMI